MVQNALFEIRRCLEAYVGQKILLRANGGRRKTIERTGVLEEIYSSVFIVTLDQNQTAFKRVSYSYADILTESVQVMICAENGQTKIKYAQG